jgi:F420-non-reducing hydrogenase iron-sulfur subunit
MKAAQRTALLRKMLVQFEIEPQRLKLEWISAAEAQKFAQVIRDFTEEIRALGPLPQGLKSEVPD